MTYLLQNEGGYVNNPNDHGGCTQFGITKISLSAFRHRVVTCEDIRALTIKEITEIYRLNYWDALRLEDITNDSIATALFDTAVVRGVGTSRLYAKYVCDKLKQPHINTCTPGAFITLFVKRLKEGYDNIAASNPTQSVFLKGWHNRADRLMTLV